MAFDPYIDGIMSRIPPPRKQEELESWEIEQLKEEEGEELKSDREKAANQSHPGFKVICKNCQSEAVMVDSDYCNSFPSGSWGGVFLKCMRCQKRTNVWPDVEENATR